MYAKNRALGEWCSSPGTWEPPVSDVSGPSDRPRATPHLSHEQTKMNPEPWPALRTELSGWQRGRAPTADGTASSFTLTSDLPTTDTHRQLYPALPALNASPSAKPALLSLSPSRNGPARHPPALARAKGPCWTFPGPPHSIRHQSLSSTEQQPLTRV